MQKFMMADRFILGAVLAGGRGERIGGGKARVDLNGAPLVAHAARALAACGEIVVVGDLQAAQLIGAPSISDPPNTSGGPLAGVSAALSYAAARNADWLALCPCDTPFLPGDIVERLLETSQRDAAPLACARGAERVQPLVSLWRANLA